LVDFPINLQINSQQVTMTGVGYDDGWHSDGWMSCDSFRCVSKINVARGIESNICWVVFGCDLWELGLCCLLRHGIANDKHQCYGEK